MKISIPQPNNATLGMDMADDIIPFFQMKKVARPGEAALARSFCPKAKARLHIPTMAVREKGT